MAVDKHDVHRPRPVNLNLMTIKFPVPAIASLLHRISGFLLFLFIPVLLWALQASLSSIDSFQALQSVLSGNVAKFFIWIFLSSLIYHFFAGIRHMIQDCGWGESLAVGRFSAYLVILLSIVISLYVGIKLW